MGLLDQAKDPEELEPFPKMLVYGDAGAGKTVLAAGAPHPVLFVDVERGTDVLYKPRHEELRKRVKVLTYGKDGDITSFSKLEGLFWELKRGGHGYKTLVVDTFSELQKRYLDELVEKSRDKRPEGIPYQQDYLEVGEKLRRLALMFRDLPEMNLVIVTHALTEKVEVEGRIIIRPSMTPKLAGYIIDMMGIVAYLENIPQREGHVLRKAVCVGTRKILAKNRYVDDVVIEDPTWNLLTGRKD